MSESSKRRLYWSALKVIKQIGQPLSIFTPRVLLSITVVNVLVTVIAIAGLVNVTVTVFCIDNIKNYQ